MIRYFPASRRHYIGGHSNPEGPMKTLAILVLALLLTGCLDDPATGPKVEVVQDSLCMDALTGVIGPCADDDG